jgi:hypothetical protein
VELDKQEQQHNQVALVDFQVHFVSLALLECLNMILIQQFVNPA